MVKKLTFMGLLLTAVALFPFQVTAQEGEEAKALTGSITVGGDWVDLDRESAKAGEYTGIHDDTVYFVGDADLSYDNGRMYIDLRASNIGLNIGSNIGLENRNIYLEGGRYGKYKIFLEYDEIPHLLSTESKTPFDGAGGSSLTLPAGFVKGGSTTAMINLNSSLKEVKLGLERKSGTAGFSVNLGRNVALKVSAKREEKDGTKSLGGTIGFLGAVVLPEPVDYTTDELRATVSYKGKTAQAEIGYHLSSFNNHDESVSWANPFNNDPEIGKTSLPPDNRYQKIGFSGGINLPYSSRFSAVAEYGEMRQDEAFLPYSNNNDLLTPTVISTALPRDSADAEINTTHVMLNLASKPIPKLGIDAKYRYYKTKNETSRDLFQYVRTDSAGTSQAATDDANAVYNLPYDYIQNQFKIDASYYLLKRTTLKAGYDRDVIDRDYREAARTAEDAYKIKISSRAIPSAFVSADYSFAKRGIDGDYADSRVYDYYHHRDYIEDTVPSDQRYGNHPDLRKFDVAERERNKYGAKITLFGSQNTAIGLNYNRVTDDYTDSTLGLTDSDNKTYTVDFSFSPVESTTVYTFYTREELSYDIAGREFVKGTSSVTDPAALWNVDNENDIDTAGIGTSVDFMEKKLVVSADYSYSQSEGSIKTSSVDMPDLKTYLHRFKVSGKYKVTENLTAGAGFEIEKYSSDDWSTDGIDPASTAVSNLLTLSGSTEDYEAHKGIMYVSYNF